MLDNTAEVGFATDEFTPGASTDQQASIGADATAPAAPSPEEVSQDSRLPFSNHPRWKEVYASHSEYKRVKPEYERVQQEYRQAQAELQTFREGRHEKYNEVAQDVIQTRDAYWEKALAEAGVLDVMKHHFTRLQNGDRQPATQEEAPWQKEIATLKEQVQAQERQRLSERLTQQFDQAIAVEAAEFKSNPRAYELLMEQATKLAARDVDGNSRSLRQPTAAYVKQAKAMLLEAWKPLQSATRPQRAPIPGPGGGAPGGDPKRDRNAAALAIAMEMAELDE